MKNLFLILTIISLLFSCQQNSSEYVFESIDRSELKKSNLSKLINNREYVKSLIRKDLIDDKTLVIDTPGGPQDCAGDGGEIKASELNLAEEEALISSFLVEMRSLRDTYLVSGQTGQDYKDTYYYLSTALADKEVTIDDIVEFVNVIPVVKSIYDKMSDDNYSGVIINNQEKADILNFIGNYKSKLDNDVHTDILNAIEDDLEILTNRNQDQITGFLEN